MVNWSYINALFLNFNHSEVSFSVSLLFSFRENILQIYIFSVLKIERKLNFWI